MERCVTPEPENTRDLSSSLLIKAWGKTSKTKQECLVASRFLITHVFGVLSLCCPTIAVCSHLDVKLYLSSGACRGFSIEWWCEMTHFPFLLSSAFDFFPVSGGCPCHCGPLKLVHSVCLAPKKKSKGNPSCWGSEFHCNWNCKWFAFLLGLPISA